MENRILIWYRNDLRLHDHAPLQTALRQNATPIPVYCFDPRQFKPTSWGFPKTGAIRAQFLIECIQDLRQSLQGIGSNLIIRWGKPEQVIPQLVQQLNSTAVYYYQETATEEVAVETAVKEALDNHRIIIRMFWGQTLYHPDDLPFDRSNIPELFTNFRKQVEKQSQVRPALPPPHQQLSFPSPFPAEADLGEIPSLADLGLEQPQPEPRAVLIFKGGETAGQARLESYFWQQDLLQIYKETRNGLLGANYSSKFSPWLATGCLSPRYIYEQVLQYEDTRIRNDSTYWLIFELLWRDYFRFICTKHGSRVFYRSGLQRISIPWKQDRQQFELWRNGKTGYPLIDANMKELAATGFMSNRGRQNVASFLTKNLGLDWRMGAGWFESQLIDYDVYSNWGNWNYSAGIGNDARGFRCFNITKQAKDYDRQGDYVKHWLPELAAVPAEQVHEPWKLTPAEQHQYGVQIGVDYPSPIVDLLESAAAQERLYNAAVQRTKG